MKTRTHLALTIVVALVCVVPSIPGAVGETSASDGTKRSWCGGVDKEDEEGVSEYVPKYQCPLKDENKAATLCCDPPQYKCCREKKFYEIDRMAGIMIAVSVVLCCVLITVGVVTCCLWEKCPLYMACRAEAKPDYIAHPDEASALTSTMPNENVKNVKVYIPKEAAARPSNFV